MLRMKEKGMLRKEMRRLKSTRCVFRPVSVEGFTGTAGLTWIDRVEQPWFVTTAGKRLCIARALLKKPKIIIFDDATSAVDTATDSRIREALRTAMPDTTKIIIAQRITSVMDADRIIVLNDGKVDDIGTHDELMARNEIYREVYSSQQKGVA